MLGAVWVAALALAAALRKPLATGLAEGLLSLAAALEALARGLEACVGGPRRRHGPGQPAGATGPWPGPASPKGRRLAGSQRLVLLAAVVFLLLAALSYMQLASPEDTILESLSHPQRWRQAERILGDATLEAQRIEAQPVRKSDPASTSGQGDLSIGESVKAAEVLPVVLVGKVEPVDIGKELDGTDLVHVDIEELDNDNKGDEAPGGLDMSDSAEANATDQMSERQFEERVLLCSQPGNVAALTSAHICFKGKPGMLRAMWSSDVSPDDVGMTDEDINALRAMAIFFPKGTVSRAKLLAASMDRQQRMRRLQLEPAPETYKMSHVVRSEEKMLLLGMHANGRSLSSRRHAGHGAPAAVSETQAIGTKRSQKFMQLMGVLETIKKLLTRQDMDAFQAGLDTERHVFVHQGNANEHRFDEASSLEMRPFLPKDESEAYAGTEFRTCAVVGNSGVLRMSAYGADIDAHDAVFRMNQAPASNGCQIYSGGRTTLRLVNARWLHKLAHGTMKHLPLEQGATLLVTRYDAKEVKRLLRQLEVTGRTDVKVRLMTASFKTKTQRLLEYYRTYMRLLHSFDGGRGDTPSTGMLALLAAMQLCDQVTLYGFGLWKQHVGHGSERKRMYHYWHSLYGKEQVDDKAHAMDTERMLFQSMNDAGLVNMCSFKDEDGDEDGWTSELLQRHNKERQEREESRDSRDGRHRKSSAQQGGGKSSLESIIEKAVMQAGHS